MSKYVEFNEELRRKLPEGEWTTEPDSQSWIDEETGLHCYIKRNHVGALCGYVGVPKDHILYEVPYQDGPETYLSAHGGITYSGWTDMVNGKWFFGFDCAHCDDLCPMFQAWGVGMNLLGGEYRNFEYVEKQCEDLARQLKTWESQ